MTKIPRSVRARAGGPLRATICGQARRLLATATKVVALCLVLTLAVTAQESHDSAGPAPQMHRPAFQEHGIAMPDDAREVIFPRGVPVTLIDRTAAAAGDVVPQRPRPAAPPAEDTDAVSTQAEAGLYSEAVVIEAQARHAQPLKGAENLLAPTQDQSTKSL